VPVFEFNVDGKNKIYEALDCQQKAIGNLPDPIHAGDAVNKHYFTEYIKQHRALHVLRNSIPSEPFTDIVLLRYNTRRSIVTMCLSCTVVKIWCFKDNGVTNLTFWTPGRRLPMGGPWCMRPSGTVTEIWRLRCWTRGRGHRKKEGRMGREKGRGRGRKEKGKVEGEKEGKGEGEEEGKVMGRRRERGRGRKKGEEEKGRKKKRGKGRKRGKGKKEKENGKGRGRESGIGRKWGTGKGKGKEKGKGRWKEESLRKVGRTDARTHARTLR